MDNWKRTWHSDCDESICSRHNGITYVVEYDSEYYTCFWRRFWTSEEAGCDEPECNTNFRSIEIYTLGRYGWYDMYTEGEYDHPCASDYPDYDYATSVSIRSCGGGFVWAGRSDCNHERCDGVTAKFHLVWGHFCEGGTVTITGA